MKFDLKAMLKEVQKEESPSSKTNQPLTQREIRELVVRRRAARKGPRPA